jgi:hypothetical protein
MFVEIVKLINEFDEVALNFSPSSSFDIELALRRVDECIHSPQLNDDHRSYLKKRLEASLGLMLHIKSVRQFVVKSADFLS